MAEIDLVPTLAALGGAGGGATLARWAVRLWAQVRREGIEAAKASTEQQRADNARMVEALVEQARSNAALAGEMARSNAILGAKLDHVAGKLDKLVEQREWTPVEGVERQDLEDSQTRASERRRAARTPALGRPGYRPPRAGTNHDGDDR